MCVDGVSIFSVPVALLSHHLQRSAYSLGIPQPRWINGCRECSIGALGSICQTSRRCWERTAPPRACFWKVNIFVVWFCFCGFMRARTVASVSVLRRRKPWLLLMPTFPRQRLTDRDGKSLPLCFSASSTSSALYSFYSISPKCCSGGMWD